MILMMAGTGDASALALAFHQRGWPMLVTTVTESAASRYRAHGIEVLTGRRTTDALAALIRDRNVRLLVDATHPFAARAHESAWRACQIAAIPYVRYERPPASIPDSPYVHWVATHDEAAEQAKALGSGGVVLLTIGSQHLPSYARLVEDPTIRVVIRLLATSDNLRLCQDLGIRSEDIVAMQGPFGARLNRALYKHFGIDVLVTKESGEAGGVGAKVRPAVAGQIHVVVVRRPKLPSPARQFSTASALMAFVARTWEEGDGGGD